MSAKINNKSVMEIITLGEDFGTEGFGIDLLFRKRMKVNEIITAAATMISGR